MNVYCRVCRTKICVAYNRHAKCRVIMFEEVPLTVKVEEEIEGRIRCKKCSSSLGRFKWHGTKCVCGEWVTPYIGIHEKAVDVSSSVE